MESIENYLEKLGLGGKKANIYLAILELGEASVIEIAKKAKIKRTTVYNILPELTQEGLVKKTMRSKRRLFFVDDVRQLKNDLEEKLKVAEKIIPDLKAIQNIIPYKPRIIFYEGDGGMKDLYEDTLESSKSGDIILSYTGLSDFNKYMPQDYAESYIARRVAKKIRIKIIAPDSEVARKWQENAQTELREIKIIRRADFKFNADMEIYANKVALISYRENFMGVIIESKEICEMMRTSFETMWNVVAI